MGSDALVATGEAIDAPRPAATLRGAGQIPRPGHSRVLRWALMWCGGCDICHRRYPYGLSRHTLEGSEHSL